MAREPRKTPRNTAIITTIATVPWSLRTTYANTGNKSDAASDNALNTDSKSPRCHFAIGFDCLTSSTLCFG